MKIKQFSDIQKCKNKFFIYSDYIVLKNSCKKYCDE